MARTLSESIEPYSISADEAKLRSEGISGGHAQAFLRVAHELDCVILTRTPGEAALTLLAEGYDAKGFHVKAKSCDWGPWAGFICAEPRFNKSGLPGAYTNLKAHIDSFTKDFEKLQNEWRRANSKPAEGPYYASVVPLELSDARVHWLESHGKIAAAEAGAKERRGEATIPGAGDAKVAWLLRRDDSSGRWRVYYQRQDLPALQGEIDADIVHTFTAALARASSDATAPPVDSFTAVLALTNPHRPYADGSAESYKNALTGDFDLFAVWPKKEKMADFVTRVGGMGLGPNDDPKDMEAKIAAEKKAIYKAEGEDIIGSTTGNLSSGVYQVAVSLNMESQKIAGQSAVNRVFHSDEGGRPGMDSVDESVAFVATGTVDLPDETLVRGHMLLLKSAGSNANALAPFALWCARAGHAIFLNTGWLTAMQAALSPDEWTELLASVYRQGAQAPGRGAA